MVPFSVTQLEDPESAAVAGAIEGLASAAVSLFSVSSSSKIIKSMTSLSFNHFSQIGDVQEVTGLPMDKFAWWQGTVINSVNLPANKQQIFRDALEVCTYASGDKIALNS